MIKKLQRHYALTEGGAKDLVRATLWTVAANLSLMVPIGLLIMVLMDIITALSAGGDTANGVWSSTALAAVLVAVIYIVHWIQYKALYIAVYDESANRRIRLAEKLRGLPLSFFGRRDLSDLTATLMSDCSSLEQAFSHFVPQLYGTIISTVIIAAGMLAFDWRLGLAVIWVVPVAALLVVASKKVQDKFGTRTLLVKREATDSLQELLETVKDIKACNQKQAYLTSLERKLGAAESATIRSELVTGTCVTSAQAFLKIGLGTTVLVGIGLLVAGQVSLVVFLIYLIAASRIYDPVKVAFENMAAVYSAQIRIERMRAIEEQPVQTGADHYSPRGYDIVFDHVKFAYNENEGVLEDISFWDVNGGKITLGGVDVSTVEPEALLTNYAIVFQDVVLFSDTVMENIRLGRRDASDEEVFAAARAAQCDEFVNKLPKGYGTMIGENGSTLSGGERQRISIARALLKDAPVILLDEATASLDVENETAVQAAISGLVQNKTVLIIAHRMRTVMGADKVVVLADGKVVETGAPEELAKSGGMFARMVELQQESAGWSIS